MSFVRILLCHYWCQSQLRGKHQNIISVVKKKYMLHPQAVCLLINLWDYP